MFRRRFVQPMMPAYTTTAATTPSYYKGEPELLLYAHDVLEPGD